MNNYEITNEAKWTIRYVLAALGFLLLTAIEGIYGYAYLAVMGAFYFLMPYLLKTEIYNKRLVAINFWLQSIGALIAWSAGVLTNYNSLFTLYWPLPVWFSRVSNLGAVIFIIGIAI